MQALPFHYIELATDLCKYAREDLQDWSLSYDLMVLILLLIDKNTGILTNNHIKPQDSIRSVRHNKIQTGLRGLDATALKVRRVFLVYRNPRTRVLHKLFF